MDQGIEMGLIGGNHNFISQLLKGLQVERTEKNKEEKKRTQ